MVWGPHKFDRSAGRWDELGPQNQVLEPSPGSISVGNDGTVVRVDTRNVAYRYAGGSNWIELQQGAGKLSSISVVSRTNMWAVGLFGEIYSIM
jgi:hypothetical protein